MRLHISTGVPHIFQHHGTREVQSQSWAPPMSPQQLARSALHRVPQPQWRSRHAAVQHNLVHICSAATPGSLGSSTAPDAVATDTATCAVNRTGAVNSHQHVQHRYRRRPDRTVSSAPATGVMKLSVQEEQQRSAHGTHGVSLCEQSLSSGTVYSSSGDSYSVFYRTSLQLGRQLLAQQPAAAYKPQPLGFALLSQPPLQQQQRASSAGQTASTSSAAPLTTQRAGWRPLPVVPEYASDLGLPRSRWYVADHDNLHELHQQLLDRYAAPVKLPAGLRAPGIEGPRCQVVQHLQWQHKADARQASAGMPAAAAASSSALQPLPRVAEATLERQWYSPADAGHSLVAFVTRQEAPVAQQAAPSSAAPSTMCDSNVHKPTVTAAPSCDCGRSSSSSSSNSTSGSNSTGTAQCANASSTANPGTRPRHRRRATIRSSGCGSESPGDSTSSSSSRYRRSNTSRRRATSASKSCGDLIDITSSSLATSNRHRHPRSRRTTSSVGTM